MRQLTSLDAQFLALESSNQTGHVAGLAILDPSSKESGELTFRDICRLMEERLPLLPPLRWRLVEVPFGLDYPYWLDDAEFDLDFHVRELALPPGGTTENLAEQVARIVSRPLDRSRPLWELYLIHGLEDGQVALLTKIHHAVVDGLSGAEIMGVLFDLAPEGRELPEPQVDGAERKPSDLQMLTRGLMGLPRYPLRVLRSLPRALPNLDSSPVFAAIPGTSLVARVTDRLTRPLSNRETGVLAHTTYKAPKTQFNGRISPHRRFAFGQLDLDEVKKVKNKHRCTVNDVVVSICAGAVRSWLLEHDDLPAGPARRAGPGLRPNRRADGHLRQPDHADERAVLHQRAERRAPPREDPPRACGHEGTAPRAARRAAPGHQPLHPARGLRARRARHLRDLHRTG